MTSSDPIKIRDAFIANFGTLGKNLGLSNTSGQILALIYLQDPGELLSAADLSRLLKTSRSTISSSLGELQNAGFVASTRELGGRREVYRGHNVFGIFRTFVSFINRRDVERMLQTSDKLLGIATDEPEVAKRIVEFREFTMLLSKLCECVGGLEQGTKARDCSDAADDILIRLAENFRR